MAIDVTVIIIGAIVSSVVGVIIKAVQDYMNKNQQLLSRAAEGLKILGRSTYHYARELFSWVAQKMSERN